MTKLTAKKELKRYNQFRSKLIIEDLKIKMVNYLKIENSAGVIKTGRIVFVNLIPTVTFSQN